MKDGSTTVGEVLRDYRALALVASMTIVACDDAPATMSGEYAFKATLAEALSGDDPGASNLIAYGLHVLIVEYDQKVPGACQPVSSTEALAETFESLDQLDLYVGQPFDDGGATDPYPGGLPGVGTYAVAALHGSSAVAYVFPMPWGGPQVAATSGSVTVTKAGKDYDGTYDLFFPLEDGGVTELRGKFNAPFCQ